MSLPSLNSTLRFLVPLITSTVVSPFIVPSLNFNGTADGGQLDNERVLSGASAVKRFTPYGYTVAGVLLTFIAIVGTFNHLCVVIIIVRNPRLRTPTNWMLLNLSASESSVLKMFQSFLVPSFAFFSGELIIAVFGKSYLDFSPP